MAASVQPLIEVLREIPDMRERQGRRHPLDAILALACAAMLCGYRSYSAIAEWGRSYDPALLTALGFTHRPTPCAATLFHVFRRLDRDVIEARLGAWAEAVLSASALPATPRQAPALEGIALDGKTLRGSRKQGAPGAHLLSAVSHRLGLTLGQTAVDDKPNEIPVAPLALAGLLLEGRVVTVDALLTQREVARAIRAGGGDYVMLAKENQPHPAADIATVFASPPPWRTCPGTSPKPRRWGTVDANGAG